MPEGDNPQGGNEQLQALLDKHKGDAMALAMALFGDNYKLREKNREMRDKVPAEGSVVMAKADADRLAAFDALGLKPEEAKAKIEAVATVEGENAKLKREGMLHSLVGAGYSLQALQDFDALEGASIESYGAKDEQKEGKAVRVAYVTVGGKELPFDDYAKEKRPALASVLKSESSAAQGGVGYVPQSPGGRPPAKDKYEEIRNDVKRREVARQGQSSDLHPMFKPQQAATS